MIIGTEGWICRVVCFDGEGWRELEKGVFWFVIFFDLGTGLVRGN